MENAPQLDGPRLVQPQEEERSRWLSQLCFGDADAALPPREPETVQNSPAPDGNSLTYAFFDRGTPVSQITIVWEDLYLYGQRVTAGFIGGVCTNPDYRNLRLAGKLLQTCTDALAERGARILIISGGRGLYRRAGCVDMGSFAGIELPAGTSALRESPFTVRTATPADAAICSRLYMAEAAHFGRKAADFVDYLQPENKDGGFHAEKLVVTQHGEVTAYVMLNTPWDFVGRDGPGVRCIFDYAGSKLAIAHALKTSVERFGLQILLAPIPWQDRDLIAALAPEQPVWVGLPEHTMRIIDLPGLMQDVDGLLAAVLPESLRRGLRFEQTGPLLAAQGADRMAIVSENARIELDGAQMTRLVFGPPLGHEAPALPGALGEIAQALFPLPAFFTGLDYH